MQSHSKAITYDDAFKKPVGSFFHDFEDDPV